MGLHRSSKHTDLIVKLVERTRFGGTLSLLLIREIWERVADWTSATFGYDILISEKERASRLFEESAELAQACGVSEEVCLKILQRCYKRPVGDKRQESAGVFLCLLAWLSSQSETTDRLEILFLDAFKELHRLEKGDIEHFRQKHLAKYNAGTGMKPTF